MSKSRTPRATAAEMRSFAASLLGSMRSERKAKSSRKNGKLYGGRPVGSKDSYQRTRRSQGK